MRRPLLLLPLVLAIPFVMLGDGRARASGPVTAVDLLLGFSAKETCSCAFVDGQTDKYCTAFGQQEGYVVDIAIDHTGMVVTSTLAGISRTSHATTGQGCVLDAL
jgi:hypothetical protein